MEVVVVFIVKTLTTLGRTICKSPISAALRYSRGRVIAYQTESIVVSPLVSVLAYKSCIDLRDQVM